MMDTNNCMKAFTVLDRLHRLPHRRTSMLPRLRRGLISLAGGILVHLAIGAVYTFGNMVSYFASYIYYENGTPTLEEYEAIKANVSITFAMSLLGQALFMPLGGFLERRIGPRATTLTGGLTYCAGVLLTSKLLYSASAIAAIYGGLGGLGLGISYAVPIAVSMRWFPENKGLVTGLTVAGFGGGSVIFSQVQYLIINPHNLEPCDIEDSSGANVSGSGPYPREVTENIPACMIILGLTYAAMVVIGCAMLCNPPSSGLQEQPLLSSGEEDAFKVFPASGFNGEGQTMPPTSPVIPVNTGGEAGILMDDTSMKGMLSTDLFWLLFTTFCLNGVCAVFVSTDWKLLGEEENVSDDAFRTTVGSVSSVFNALGRIAFGILVDRFGFAKANISLCAGWIAVLTTTSYVGTTSPACYFVWICLNFFFLGGNFALYAPTTSELFGGNNVGRNYGLLFFSQIPGAIISSFLLGALVENLPRTSRWNILTVGFASLPAISIFFTFVYARRRQGWSERKLGGRPVYSVLEK